MKPSSLNLHDALLLHQQGNIQDAISAYLAIEIKDDNTQVKQYELLGIAHAQLNELTTALSYFEKAHKLAPSLLSIQNNLGTCYKKMGHAKKAVKLYLDILKHNPFQCVTLNNLASLYIDLKKEDQAIILLKKAISLRPEYNDAYYNLGLILKDAQYFKFAADLQHGKSAYQYALNQETQKNYEVSKTYYNQCLDNALSHHGLARVLLALDQDEDALYHFIQAQKLDPSIPHLMENIASYYHIKGMHVNAVEYWLKSLSQTDDPLDIWYNVGVAYQHLNRHEDALRYLNMVLEKEPNHQKAHTNIAALALQNNQREIAIIHYEKVISLDPKNEEIQYILSALKQKDHQFEQSPANYVSNLFDQYAGHYNQHLLKMLKYQLPEKVKYSLHEYLKPKSDKTILDLGCGTGLLGSTLSPFAKELTGVDLSPNMLTEAFKTGFYHHLIQQDALTYLNDANTFDLIIALELCPYIGNIEPLLQSIHAHLSIDGMFIFSIETGSKSYALSENARYQHNVIWVNNLLDTIGFSIVEEEPTILRTQNTKPVSGHWFIIKRNPA
jgi:predicted TPR repeat methyltransferase